MLAREQILARLALGDDVVSLPACDLEELDIHAVDQRNSALVQLVRPACTGSVEHFVEPGGRRGAAGGRQPGRDRGCLVGLVPTLGVARVSNVVPSLALALGFTWMPL